MHLELGLAGKRKGSKEGFCSSTRGSEGHGGTGAALLWGKLRELGVLSLD